MEIELEKHPNMEKNDSHDSEDLDLTCKSSCGVDLRWHMHQHAKKVKAFFQRLLAKLKMLIL